MQPKKVAFVICNQKRLHSPDATKKGCIFKDFLLSLQRNKKIMRTTAIITGDIVDSTKLNLAERDIMINALQAIPEILSPFERISMEIFRGDSFQVKIPNSEIAAKAAIAIRAWLRSQVELCGKEPLDARLAIGIGGTDYESDTLSTSDGEAFRLSGRLLDKMQKVRLAVATPWTSVNEELRLSTAFVDDIISSWTQNQSKIMLLRLQTSKSHLELSQILEISRQMVDKSLKSSKEDLVEAYIDRFEKLIIEHTRIS